MKINLAKRLTASSMVLEFTHANEIVCWHHAERPKETEMINCNWMVKLANAQRKALINLGYTSQQVNGMSLADTTQELKSLGYDFKTNSPLKNK